ncbi:MAG: hypothetical protein H6821_01255 [Planctomycetaceae bacterium]|nr:hypothetical protein [Planctomycetales bacterium]MCB9872778.1 hypothetical protein [Planctomycetaceae bacterium]MCB9926264.1 hypothetical protein [Planctomycetaceae bacterium]
MDEVKKKVLMAVFAAPSSLLPIFGGLGALAVSWAGGGNAYLFIAGVAGVAGGVGLMAYRWAFGLEKLTASAFTEINAQQRQEQEDKLDSLEAKLRGDRDPRTQTYLRHLRELYRDFQSDLNEGRVSASARTVLMDVENLFRAAVKHLEQSYHLWETASRMAGEPRRAMLEAREQVVQEVHKSVEHVSKIIEQFHTFRVKEDESELAKLRQELDNTMQAARRAEERVAAFGKPSNYDISEFE